MTDLRNLKRITDEDTARTILDMIEGRRDPREVSEACDQWVRWCYNTPTREEQALHAADDLLGTCGVEGYADEDGRGGVSYCNTGDTYALTLFLDHGAFRVSSYYTMAVSGRLK